MIYIIALLLLILVLAIPAARNILFVLMGSAAALAVVGLILVGLILLGMWLYSLDWSWLASKPDMNRASKALTKTTEILTPSWTGLDTVLLLAVAAAFVLFIIYDQRKLRK